ncbi:HAMP domain-containing histidine kinase [Solibacillus sp. MA9]|uniref:histidine kinase n=1 Tax=Solibacillus palustris TaxID=2908203 RepID=A0ABS9U7Y3_9BACL|nr:MFS domain-containing histidine kinase [Solibacillus sp. MA9]MCH7320353.1 HAMP domain-containing histidine kinase [Solibacillus sp. MA9]
MNNKKSHLQLFFMFIVVFAILVILEQGNNYFGKDYFESNSFDSEAEQFAYNVARYEINPLTKEDFAEVLTVTKDDIVHYRTYYGSLAQQIQNIKDQYAEDINNAQDEDVLQALKSERDAKIADIQKNFEDDAYVSEKIKALKEQVVNEILADNKRNQQAFFAENKQFAYELHDDKYDLTFKKNDVKAASVFKKTISNNDLGTHEESINLYEYEQIGFLDKTYTIEKDFSTISGTVTIPKSMLSKTHFGNDLRAFTITKYIYYSIIIAGIVSFILLVKVFNTRPEALLGKENGLRNILNRLPIDMASVLVAVVVYMTLLFISSMTDIGYSIANYFQGQRYINVFENILQIAATYGMFVLSVYLIIWIWVRFKSIKSVEKLWENMFLSKLVKVCIELFENRSMGIQSLILLMVIFLGGFGFAVFVMSGTFEVFLFYMFLFVVFFIPALYIFLHRIGYLNRIMKHTDDMAHGRLTDNLMVKGKSPLAKHAENLNGLREGVRTSLNEQAKSERLKTELITNVSHDLRTPLTSIITYTDLLKNPDITAEERQKYIEILDAKSGRLKTLIEDLFEVSKMASGNIEISKQRIDLVQLLQQAVGEHEEEFATSNLDLRVAISEQPIYAYVDGQKWWRVIDNLIVNARKYSLEGTRVYVNLKVNNGNAELTVKNVAKYELNEDAGELVERFKRADTSRHTEGSGLGLAIAQSIVDLHGGQLDISVDGDLFKVTVFVHADK